MFVASFSKSVNAAVDMTDNRGQSYFLKTAKCGFWKQSLCVPLEAKTKASRSGFIVTMVAACGKAGISEERCGGRT